MITQGSGFKNKQPPQTVKSAPVPAPQKGINAIDGMVAMDPQESIFQYNMVPSQYGVRVRTGYKEWATNIGAVAVRTIVPYNGSLASKDRLFACAQEGIYNITASGSVFATAIAFGSADATSGYGQWTNYTTIAGPFSLYTDETNGYYVYDEGPGTWAKVAMGAGATQINGVDPALFVGVTIFKSRAWFIQKNTASAWYLPVGSIFGAATQFNFGNKFKHGGTLVQLINWTVDGGEGIDDYLIAISSSGDVVVYKGNDPSSATDFLQHGSWYIGVAPAGRRIAGSFGGEVYILSIYGLLPMSKLISGQLVQTDDIYLTKKIAPLIKSEIALSQISLGWEVKLIPTEQALIIATAKRASFPYQQFVQSLNSQGWCIYQNLPYYTGESFNSKFYFASGTTVYSHEGDLDAVNLAGSSSTQITWSALQIFNEYGEIGLYKQTQYIRPVFLSQAPPSYAVEARYDYNINPLTLSVAPATLSAALWDAAVWDGALWAGDFTPVQSVSGASGMGRAIAIGIQGTSGARTILIRYDSMYTSGNYL